MLTSSGSLGTGFAKVGQNPVNLRGSLKALPQEGRCEPNEKGSASSADGVGTPIAGTVGAQPERTSVVGHASACAAGGQRRQLVYGCRPPRRARARRFSRHLGSTVQPGWPGSGGTPGRWASAHPVWSGGTRSDSEGVSAPTGSRAGWDGDLVLEHAAARAAPRIRWPTEGEYVHHLGGAARCWHHLAEGPKLVPDRRCCPQAQAWRSHLYDPDASAKKA
jgi:hypothetical protein